MWGKGDTSHNLMHHYQIVYMCCKSVYYQHVHTEQFCSYLLHIFYHNLIMQLLLKVMMTFQINDVKTYQYTSTCITIWVLSNCDICAYKPQVVHVLLFEYYLTAIFVCLNNRSREARTNLYTYGTQKISNTYIHFMVTNTQLL